MIQVSANYYITELYKLQFILRNPIHHVSLQLTVFTIDSINIYKYASKEQGLYNTSSGYAHHLQGLRWRSSSGWTNNDQLKLQRFQTGQQLNHWTDPGCWDLDVWWDPAVPRQTLCHYNVWLDAYPRLHGLNYNTLTEYSMEDVINSYVGRPFRGLSAELFKDGVWAKVLQTRNLFGKTCLRHLQRQFWKFSLI